MRLDTRASIDDLYCAEGKTELVAGEIVCLPPAGDPPNGANLTVSACEKTCSSSLSQRERGPKISLKNNAFVLSSRL